MSRKWSATRRSRCDNFIEDAKQSIVWKEVSQALRIALLHLKQNNPHKKYAPLNRKKTTTIWFAIKGRISQYFKL